ncbi:MAG: hypothetical protein KDA78_19420, partial [Planctomycetaceae bacterium]|nr:hypothetical protein [Planctomycetaceae bacterium]
MTLRAHPETGPVWTPSRFTVDAARLRGRLGFFRRTFGACCLILLTVFSLSGELAAQPDNPLITEADTEILRRKAIDYNKALGASSLTQADIALLNEMSKAQVLQMSLSSKQRELSDIRERIKRDMNLLAKPAARGAILPQFAQHATTLLKDQPLPVRINACMLLTELNEEPPVIQKQIPAVPFLGVADALIQVLADPDQHTAVKIIAAKGLMRICRDGKPKVDLRTRIADVMVDQLKTQGSNEWYRRTLIESVSWTSVLFDKTRKPYIIQT